MTASEEFCCLANRVHTVLIFFVSFLSRSARVALAPVDLSRLRFSASRRMMLSSRTLAFNVHRAAALGALLLLVLSLPFGAAAVGVSPFAVCSAAR